MGLQTNKQTIIEILVRHLTGPTHLGHVYIPTEEIKYRILRWHPLFIFPVPNTQYHCSNLRIRYHAGPSKILQRLVGP